MDRPRYRVSAWKVPTLIPELSVICVFIAEGCFVYIELSTISAFSVEGSRLDTEPSVIWSIIVEGSVLDKGTIRDMEH